MCISASLTIQIKRGCELPQRVLPLLPHMRRYGSGANLMSRRVSRGQSEQAWPGFGKVSISVELKYLEGEVEGDQVR